jgi:hypothetical protein
MYRTRCLTCDDYSYQDPSEASALSRLNGHLEEHPTHEVALTGVYDSPANAGVHSSDGVRDLRPGELDTAKRR